MAREGELGIAGRHPAGHAAGPARTVPPRAQLQRPGDHRVRFRGGARGPEHLRGRPAPAGSGGAERRRGRDLRGDFGPVRGRGGSRHGIEPQRGGPGELSAAGQAGRCADFWRPVAVRRQRDGVRRRGGGPFRHAPGGGHRCQSRAVSGRDDRPRQHRHGLPELQPEKPLPGPRAVRRQPAAGGGGGVRAGWPVGFRRGGKARRGPDAGAAGRPAPGPAEPAAVWRERLHPAGRQPALPPRIAGRVPRRNLRAGADRHLHHHRNRVSPGGSRHRPGAASRALAAVLPGADAAGASRLFSRRRRPHRRSASSSPKWAK